MKICASLLLGEIATSASCQWMGRGGKNASRLRSGEKANPVIGPWESWYASGAAIVFSKFLSYLSKVEDSSSLLRAIPRQDSKLTAIK